MSVDELVRILWRRKWTVILTVLVATAATYLVGRSLSKVYSAEATLVVSSTAGGGSDFEVTQAAQALARTYAELIQSENIAQLVIDDLDLDDTPKDLLDRVSFTPIEDTRLLIIDAEAPNPPEAVELADGYAEVFEEYAADSSLGEQTQGTVALADPATAPTDPDRPRPALYAAVMLFLSSLLGGGIAVLRDRLEQRLGTVEEVGPSLDLPVLTRVPVTSIERLSPLDPSSEPAFLEAFRVLWANLELVGPGMRPASILVTSPGPREGKTASSVGLARVVAEQGYRVTLIEADLRRPRLAPNGDGGGLSRLLDENLPFEEVVEQTEFANLFLIAAGSPGTSPANLLRPHALEQLVTEAAAWSDLVILDSPPVSAGSDAILLARAVDAIVLVVSSRKTERSRAIWAVTQLRRTRAPLVGLVVNEVSGAEAEYAYQLHPSAGGTPVDALGSMRGDAE